MEEFNGSRCQIAMDRNRATYHMRASMCFPVRGKILPNGVRYKDQNGAQQTLVDVFLYDYYPAISNVPLTRNKINGDNGEEWSPEPGDLVLVQFIAGNFRDPVITGYLAPAGNGVEGEAAVSPRYTRRMNGTAETIAQDGTRIIYVAKDETIEIVGDGTVSIGGDLHITVTGDANISISGNATIDTQEAHFTNDVSVGGNFTAVGDIKSTGGDVSDKVRSQADDRLIFDLHNHISALPGEPTSPPTLPE